MNIFFRVSDAIIKIVTTLFRKRLSLPKRHKIILVSIILSLGLISTQLVPFYLTYRFIAGLAILVFFLSIWALWEGLTPLKAMILAILPVLFTLGVAIYYFYLLPVRWLTRIPVTLLFGLIFYTLLLSQNVFNVAAIRTIPLYRVASTTVFVLTVFTAFMLFSVMFAFNLFFIWNGVIVFLITFPLVLHVIWSLEMEGINSLIITYSIVLSLIVGELAMALSFWPILKPINSLMLATGLYIILGICTQTLKERLTASDYWLFIGFGSVVFLIATATTSWTG